ncbi:hypothetical protein DB30_02579 [Enhygromyxa salina]|uniref:Uncharacterized protein n=1 Tax=Enhygromyxa salina TaxID=215803 RepID=A0A0C2CPV3_9BACT|nr:hypothetical protein DB30_02579 [Enhygromyxa salina]
MGAAGEGHPTFASSSVCDAPLATACWIKRAVIDAAIVPAGISPK